ncbi:large-conductance mechanosensitive channel [Fimicolochytrium jonesii]|uniref:large-conductance mechanosensitive channel n=1 Tax=Fimicolochytrium jonesii TaxID=1396493 RepID=UPI0022FEC8B4|nr:large-conductance mechanosensitive channel [Fimicolochytrium jonesii]KAI8819607.1 large-conductance mechanosensitive channel [Fimicolochytrium jonesii]
MDKNASQRNRRAQPLHVIPCFDPLGPTIVLLITTARHGPHLPRASRTIPSNPPPLSTFLSPNEMPDSRPSTPSERRPLLPRAVDTAREVTRSNWDDFKEFINRGRVLDLAIGVVIGAAFSSIVSSVVDDLLSPILGLLAARPLDQACEKHRNWCEDPQTVDQAKEVGIVTWNYGHFLQRILYFSTVTIILFLVIKAYTSLLHERSKFLKRLKDCPYCLEEISEKASKCMFCGSSVTVLHRGVPVGAGDGEHAIPQPASVSVTTA